MTGMVLGSGLSTYNREFETSASIAQQQQGAISPQHRNNASSLSRNASPSVKPVVRPKSEALNTRYAPSRRPMDDDISSRPSSDALADRFARLRAPSDKSLDKGTSTNSRGHQTSPSPAQRDSGIAHPVRDSSQSTFQDKPVGPRRIPISTGPPPPPKIPLSTQVITSMPRAPSPTYSPGWNSLMPSGEDDPPQRSIEDSELSNGFSKSRTRPGTSLAPRNVHDDVDSYQSRTSTDYDVDRQWRRPSVGLAMETSISAERLYDYLKLFKVLLVDVRNREAFDQGHVFAQSVLCIEPAGLHTGMSGEELEERLILSPDAEQRLFKQRHLYDLVVYYDQSSTSTRYLKAPREQAEPPALRAFSDAISDFSYDKLLQRRPVLLMGGLDAWADLVGTQALKTSNTARFDGRIVTRPAQKSRGGNTSSSAYNPHINKGKMRDYDPLEPEEQQAWLDRARQEGANVTDGVDLTPTGSDQGDDLDGNKTSPMYHSYEDFLRRFPEAPSLEQSMVSGPSTLSQSSTVRDGPVLTPNPPSRPPPAVPRRTYSGVSERVAPQSTTLSRSSQASQPPLYTSTVNAGHRRMRLPRTGLINFSVTCYMNATIQCMSATLPLTGFFLDNSYKSVVQKNWKGSHGVMPELYANVLRELWKGDVEAIRPASFRVSVRLNCPLHVILLKSRSEILHTSQKTVG